MTEDMFRRMRRSPLRDSSPLPKRLPQAKPESVAEPKQVVPVVKKKRNTKRIWFKLLAILTVLLFVATVVYGTIYFRNLHAKKTKTNLFGQQISQQTSLATYYPQNLPSGYTYNNDASILQPNVVHFSVTTPDNKKISVTQQQIPAKFDFTVFNNKFLNPDTFDTGVGTVTAGQLGNMVMASVRTNNNTWIIINPVQPNINNLDQIESIARSFVPANQN